MGLISKIYNSSGSSILKKKNLNQKIARNFPDGTVDKELTYLYRQHKFNPWSRKIPHAVGRYYPHSGTHAPQQREATTMRSPGTAIRE